MPHPRAVATPNTVEMTVRTREQALSSLMLPDDYNLESGQARVKRQTDEKRAFRQMSAAASKLPFLQALVETESAARREMIIRVAC